jgi:hypothetical protein
MCCKETVNSVIKASVVLHNFIRIQGGLFSQGAENYAVNQSSYHISAQLIKHRDNLKIFYFRICSRQPRLAPSLFAVASISHLLQLCALQGPG